VKPFLPLAVAFLLAPQGTSPTVKVTFDQEADFSRFKTYDWVPTQEPAANPVNHIRMTRAVERELEAKGLKKSMENPDLRVTYFAKVEKKLKGTGYQEETPWSASSDLRTVVDFKRVQEGTVIIELLDDDTKLTLWRGVATGKAPPPDEVGPVIDSTVKKILADYPPPAAPSPKPD
jgi:Domain of unknown function (DUF4136)